MKTGDLTSHELSDRLLKLDPTNDISVRVSVEGQWTGVWDVEMVMEGNAPVIYLRTD